MYYCRPRPTQKKSTPKQPKLPATNECAEKRSNCHPAGAFYRRDLLFPQRLRERQFPRRALESVSELRFCVRARLQPCRNRRDVSTASAAEGTNCQSPHRLFSWTPPEKRRAHSAPNPQRVDSHSSHAKPAPSARHKLAHRGSGGENRKKVPSAVGATQAPYVLIAAPLRASRSRTHAPTCYNPPHASHLRAKHRPHRLQHQRPPQIHSQRISISSLGLHRRHLQKSRDFHANHRWRRRPHPSPRRTSAIAAVSQGRPHN
jgi:hypothetical protein